MSRVDLGELAREGWQRRHVDSEPRLSEAVETYRELGFEVLLVPMLEVCAAEGSGVTCTTCFGGDEDSGKYRVIFTRRMRDVAPTDADELV